MVKLLIFPSTCVRFGIVLGVFATLKSLNISSAYFSLPGHPISGVDPLDELGFNIDWSIDLLI